jgi:ABC-type sugar transport system ATPase subunit
MPDAAPPLLTLQHIGKAFGGVPVLRDVDFELRPGEIHALVGENGAGKSTLIKIIGGVHTAYDGTVSVGGHPVRFDGPRAAEHRGIAVIHQELSLVPHLSAAENIFLGHERTNRLGCVSHGAQRRAAAELLRQRLGVTLDVGQPVARLPIALQQLVEIAKAVGRTARVLILDEPTSALGEQDTQRLLSVVRQLRDAGLGLIYISHKLEEVYALADRITVLRDGQRVLTAAPRDVPIDQLVNAMVGRAVTQLYPRRATNPGDELLRISDLWLGRAGHWTLADVNLSVRAGEIVGVAGLVGSGASELLGAAYGRFGPPAQGTVTIGGKPLARWSPRAALRQGAVLLTNDRQASGLVLPMTALQNATLAALPRLTAAGLMSGRRERAAVGPLWQRLRIRAANPLQAVATLSGGNQQKVLLARWLLTRPRVLLLDEPTRGIDVGAKADVYALLAELAAAGLGIVLTTSELPELLALADRITVLHRGRQVASLSAAEATQTSVLRAAAGLC